MIPWRITKLDRRTDMKASNLYQHTSGLLAGASLLLSCFLLSGCANQFIRTPTLFGEHRDQFPAIVLTVDKNIKDEYAYTFNKKTTIAGVEISKFLPNKKFWRLRVFRYSDGMRIGGTAMDYEPITEDMSVTLVGLPAHKLLRFDLDFCDLPSQCKDTDSYSVNALLHPEELELNPKEGKPKE